MSDRIVAIPAASGSKSRGEAASWYKDLLRLLDESAPPSSFQKLAEAARKSATESASEIGDAVAAAMRIRATVEHKHQRELELSALYETARDLSALRNTDQVLRAIVQRARQLVGSDIAYLSAADDERGDFYVRATEGVVSPGFSEIRVARDIGVCGSVARSRRAFHSSNYAADRNFDHDDAIDQATRDEGIVSILGIPLELESHVIGVLFVCDRYSRSYSPQEMAVLSSLGTFAALAIENASLLEEAQRALGQAKDANAALKAKADEIEEAATAHEELTGLIAQGGTLEHLAALVSNLLKGQAGVVDEARKPLAGSVSLQVSDKRLARAILESDHAGRSIQLTAPDGSVTMVAAATGGSVRLGSLVLTREKPLTPSETRTFERSAIVTSIVLLSIERLAQMAHRDFASMVSALLRGTYDPIVQSGARRLPPGVSLSWPVTVMLVELNELTAAQALTTLRPVLTQSGTVFAEFMGNLAIVTNNPDPESLAKNVSDKLQEAFGDSFSIVISGPVSNIEQMPARYESLSRCLGIMESLSQNGRVVFEETLSIYGMLFAGKGKDSVELFIQSAIGPIIAHDLRRGSQFAATLLAYLDTGRSMQKAAETLGIHVNTLRQRVENIGRISPDWADPRRALEVHLALQMHRLRHPA